MKLLSANLIITTHSEQRRQRHLLIEVLAVTIISFPLWGANLAPIIHSWSPMVSIASFTPAPVSESTSLDGFAAYALAQKAMWQLQPSASTGNLVDPDVEHPHGGLVGAAVDPTFACKSDVGMVADYSYDNARAMSQIATIVTALVAILLFGFRLKASKRKGELTKVKIAKALIYTSLLTAAVHMIGTYILNNFGGLTSGL
jgi:hypothetical protein